MSRRIIRYWPRAGIGDGGITRSVRSISAEKSHAGASVGVAVLDEGGPGPVAPFEWLRVNHGGFGRFRYPRTIEDHLEGADLLVLHSAWTAFNIRAAMAADRLGVPYLLEPRGAYNPAIRRRRRNAKRAWWWALERRLVQRAAGVHVFFESERTHLEEMGYTGPTIVVPNGVSVPNDAQWDGGSGGYLLWIGRYDPEHKGIDLLIRAMQHLPAADRPHLRLHGPDWAGGKERVVRLVHELGLEDDVTVGEAVYGEEKWRVLSEAAAFAYPSRWEGFGNAAAEAAGVGVPTLVTPYPLGRWLQTLDLAVVAEPNPEALAEGVLQVLALGQRHRAEANRRRFHEALSWGGVARSWLNQIEDIL